MKRTRFSEDGYIKYLNESRASLFWDKNQFKLILEHIALEEIHRFLDVGCGLGYLTFLMSGFLNKDCDILGIDIDSKLINIARGNAKKYNLFNILFEVGNTYALKEKNDSFDFIAAQLVLSHLERPENAIKELLRVLKPGGYLLLIEPNNLAMSVVYNNITKALSIKEKLGLLSFEMKVQQGKIKIGEGYDNYGDHVLELLVKEGLKILDIRLCDKLDPVYPPFNTLQKEQLINSLKDELSPYWKNLFKKYYFAAAGTPDDFEQIWKLKENINKKVEAAIIDNNYYDIRAGILYSYLAQKKGMNIKINRE